MKELKKCPFCSADIKIYISQFNNTKEYRPRCSNGECPTSIEYYSEEEAVKAINNRPSEDSIKVHAVAVLAKEVARCGYFECTPEHRDPTNDEFESKWKTRSKEWEITCVNEALKILGWEL